VAVLVAIGAALEHQESVALGEAVPGEVLLGVSEGAGGVDIDVDGNGKKEAPKQKLGFTNIPGFVFRHMGEESDTSNILECEEACEKHDTCRSYSFNKKEGICVWSVETIRYRIGWEFWTKVHDLDAFGKKRHYGKYRSFPDIMYQEPGYRKLKKITVKNCQKACTKEPKCKAFSYQPKRMRCYLADSGIHYDPDFMYYERTGMKPRKNVMDMEDMQDAIQRDEKAAKKAKRRRILQSMQEREDKNHRTAQEMKNKGNVRESTMKKDEKGAAEKRLAREKILEKHDKRLAKMKQVYNEGYFKAKGVMAEKKSKERDIKKMRSTETNEKDKRKMAMTDQRNSKKREERGFKKKRHKSETRLMGAKEKLTKIKNQEMELEIDKEEKVLSVAKNLALESTESHVDAIENEKETKFHAVRKKKRAIRQMNQKAQVAKHSAKVEKVMLEKMKQMTEDGNYDSHLSATMGNAKFNRTTVENPMIANMPNTNAAGFKPTMFGSEGMNKNKKADAPADAANRI